MGQPKQSRSRYLYHSFPRRAMREQGRVAERRGLDVLRSIVRHGLLLTPERTIWRETLLSGTFGKPVELLQKRVCFTELAPSELSGHAAVFGSFAIEYEVDVVRRLGGVPVFYLPNPGVASSGGEGIGPTLMTRLGEIQALLERLNEVEEVGRSAGATEQLVITRNGAPTETHVTARALRELLGLLTSDTRPIRELVGALRALSGFFYPLDDPIRTGPLQYYRQNEWRLIANLIAFGRPIARALTKEEVREIAALDPAFFRRTEAYPTGDHERIAQCQLLASAEGRHPLELARRVIVPQTAVDVAGAAVASLSQPPPVVGLEAE